MEWIDLLSIVLALMFGTILGLEREIFGKPAGVRTNALICVGAAIFTIVSLNLAAGTGADSARIAAQIVSGIGFLGAGSIIQDRLGIHGLTTAATIWIAAAIGMACGARFHLLALVSTVTTMVVLLGLTPVAKWIAADIRSKKAEKASEDIHSDSE